MIARPTVFILGAGASEPYGFPIGRELVDKAISLLRHDTDPRVSMVSEACECPVSHLRAFADALERSMTPSIDLFLEQRDDFLSVGKAVIAALLIPFENENELFRRDKQPDRLGRRWYDYVLNKCASHPDDFRNTALSIVTFNYDRSEHFMTVALQSRYGVDIDTVKWLAPIPVIHLHGQLGALGEKVDFASGIRPFRPEVTARIIQLAAKGIRIACEAVETDSTFSHAKELLARANEIWVLGFGYLPRNVRRLDGGSFDVAGRVGGLRIVGTAYGLASAERAAAITTMTPRNNPRIDLGLPNHDVLSLLREKWFVPV